jgi:hypothetical protein
MDRAVMEQGRGRHRHVGACEQHLHDVVDPVDPGRGSERALDLSGEDGDPAEREAQLRRAAEVERGLDVEHVQVDVRLVEAVEEHQPVGAGVQNADGKMPERRVIRRELDRQGHRHRVPHCADELELARFHRGRGVGEVGRY